MSFQRRNCSSLTNRQAETEFFYFYTYSTRIYLVKSIGRDSSGGTGNLDFPREMCAQRHFI
ncbi:Uncharacterized protein APZ42_032723 [Daphnia magna]|uniref:Uncharacterized protein n=1 Tax=Daphnia magna TaxID=35525 RepID=A0A0P6FHF7_9CRUS|nr:Uncharacterized protein APZ42_032723 [Daphnia magna]